MSTLELEHSAGIESVETNENESNQKSPDQESAYMALPEDQKLNVDRLAEVQTTAQEEAIAQFDSLNRQAMAIKNDQLAAWTYALGQKYSEQILAVKEAIASGIEANVPTGEDLEHQIKIDILAVTSQIAEEQKKFDAEQIETQRNHEAHEATARYGVERALAAQEAVDSQSVATSAEAVVLAPDASSLPLGEASTPKEAPRKKRGFFQNRRYTAANGVYNAIDRLAHSEAIAISERWESLSQRVDGYSDAATRMDTEGYIPNRKNINNGKKFLNELKDYDLQLRSQRGDILSKDEKKRLKKIAG